MAPPLAGDEMRVRAVLRVAFADAAATIQPLGGGVFSRGFACLVDGREYVVRLNRAVQADEGFVKDGYAARHFASAALPIPPLIATGHLGEDAYAITERVPGRTLADWDADARLLALPALLDTLDAIGRVDVGAGRGFGYWDGTGRGQYATWRDYLAAAMHNDTSGYYQDWHALFRESFLEREVCDAVYAHLLRLLPACPEVCGLIHNDYWFENVLAEGARITGVIDWANAIYGDPFYDIARLTWGADYPDWWYPDGAAILRARYGGLPNFAARYACYACHFGLDDLRFYAKTGRRTEYGWARERLLRVLSAED